MRITTRIAAGQFLMAALLIAALAYQVTLVDRLQGINRELAFNNLEAARISVRLLQGLEGVREFAAKAAVLRDADYRQQLEYWEEAVETGVRSLSDLGLSPKEEEIRARIEGGWWVYRRVAPSLWSNATFLPGIEAVLDDIQAEVDLLIATNETGAQADYIQSVEKQARVLAVAWGAAGSALLLGLLVSVLLYRSISGPLRRLTQGTRELARGRFDHRLVMGGPTELSALARDFNYMAARLDELEDLKRDFVSHVSHELKTPLAAVHETVDVMLEGLPGPLTPKQHRLLGLSRSSLDRLSSMIGELLEMSKLEAGAARYDPSRSDMRDIVRSVLEEVEPLAEERALGLVFGPPAAALALVCDRERVRDVVVNLVGNAVKFSPSGGRITVAASLTNGPPPAVPRQSPVRREEGPLLLLTVEDEGPGVPDEHKDRIFEKFHQVRGTGKKVTGQGVGLGLAISRRIVEAHGGAIWVTDGEGGGATFSVLLPVHPSRWPELVPEEAVSAPPSRQGWTAAPMPERVPAGALSVLLAVLVGGGCASGGAGVPPEPVAPEPAVEEPVFLLPAVDAIPVRPSLQSQLVLARSLLASGQYDKAAADFQRILSLEPTRQERSEAIWGLALVHLLPASPFRDQEQAMELLALLEEEHPETMAGIHASWARLALQELSDARRQAQSQTDLIRQLQADMELLRRIDLERRPSRPPQRPDSVPRAPGSGG